MRWLTRLLARCFGSEPAGRRPVVEELEPRILYSADANPLIWGGIDPDRTALVAPVASGAQTDAAQAMTTPQQERRREIVFVDAAVPDAQSLIDAVLAQRGVGVQIEVVQLNAEADGLAQIRSVLDGERDIDAVHIVSHGGPGLLRLGNVTLDAAALDARADELRGWAAALNSDADMLIYGCDVAQGDAGQAFVRELSRLTGADVAASNDATGHVSRGGNWTLEYASGSVETAIVFDRTFQSQWVALLPTYQQFTNFTSEQEVKNAEQWGQTFQHNSGNGTYSVNQIGLAVRNNQGAQASDSITLQLRDSWNGTVLASATVNGSALTTSLAWVDFTFAGVTLNDNQSYTIRISANTPVGKIYVGENTSGGYANGSKIDKDGSALPSEDIAFRVGATGSIAVTAVAGLLTSEAGASAQFSVVLTQAPTASVTIPVSSSDTSEGTVSIALLTFTTANWNVPQVVTVTGVDDGLADGFQPYTIVLGTASSADATYNGQNPTDVQAANADNDITVGQISVDTASDAADGDTSSLSTLAANRGADGLISLREAIIAANNTANGVGGADRIVFAIAGTGTHTIAPTSALPVITGAVTIDATTDDSFAANGNRPAIVLAGSTLGLGVDGLVLGSTADGSTIRGLVIQDWGGDGIEIQAGSDGNTIAGNYIGRLTTSGTDSGAGTENGGSGIYVLGSNNTIGGTTAADRNVISGNSVYGIALEGAGATLNAIAGNYVGLTATGTALLGNGNDGVFIINGASNNTVGGATTAHRNVIAGNSDGVQIGGASGGANNNVIRGNYIGTDVTGTLDFGNNDDGVDIDNAALNNQVLDNVIAGNNGDGIDLGDAGASTGTIIRGNFIGTQANGTSALGNSGHGILVGNGGTANNTTIGGTSAGQGNTIAFNAGDGIYVTGTTTGVRILGNAIHSNTGLAVDLGTDGVTANDASPDSDSGANNLQNFPVLTSVVTDPSINNLWINGRLNSAANTTYRIEFFFNTTADASGYGEGQAYWSWLDVTTDATGLATFASHSAATLPVGRFVTATATNATTGDTSEFSAAVAAVADTLIVDTTSDVVDGDTTTTGSLIGNRGADGRISLREALIAANNTSGADTVNFSIAGGGPHTINLASALPSITQTVTINGASEPDYAGAPVVVLNGQNTVVDGLRLYAGSDGSTVRGLVIQNFTEDGIELNGSGGHTIAGNWIGLNAAGTGAAGNATGINVYQSHGNTIGGTTAADRNVVSGNSGRGIYLIDSNNNLVRGNYVGTDASGLLDVNGNTATNGQSGIVVFGAASGNVIGGTSASMRNVVSGNNWYGVELLGGASANLVQGNWIGVDATGQGALGNAQGGASFWGGATNNTLGGGAAGAGNVISANGTGVLVANASTNNRIQGNLIGLAADGSTARGNADIGIYFANGGSASFTSGNLVGSDGDGSNDAGERNVISANADGIVMQHTEVRLNTVAGNYIGLDASGTLDRGNLGRGVALIDGATQNTIGGSMAARRNVISGNDSDGIALVGTGTTANIIRGNYIGTNAAGNAAVANGVNGIGVYFGASGNLIGGNLVGEGNLISGNANDGIVFANVGTSGNTVQGNTIGLNAAGTATLGNGAQGVWIGDGTTGNLIGGAVAGAGNVIGGNTWAGITLGDAGTSGNVIAGNSIGTNAAGTLVAGNAVGIYFYGGASNNTIGGTSLLASNLIAYNALQGIAVTGAGSTGNALLGNRVRNNGQLGIDLGEDGVTPNDAADGDGGPNHLQNFPVLFAATSGGGDTLITGTLNSTANTTLRIEFFSSAAGSEDASGHGEGQTYLGFATVTTDASGNATINATLTGVSVAAGHRVTATATADLGGGNYGSTSEFAMNVIATRPNTAPAGSNGTITATEDTTYTFTLADFGFSDTDGHGLLRVWFDTLPAAGTLMWNGTPFAAGNFVSAGDIAAGLLTYSPPANASGSALASVAFRVQDDGGALNGGSDTDATANTLTINVSAVNDTPGDLYTVTGVAEPGLIGVYTFGSPNALGRDDAGGNAPITLYGSPTQTTGPTGSGALDLAGGSTGQYGHVAGITTGGAMTIAGQVRFDSTGDWQRIVDFGQDDSTGISAIYVGRLGNSNDLTFTIEKNLGGGVFELYRATAGGAITNGTWMHFAATVDANGQMSTYINGTLSATTAGVAPEIGVRTNNYIGKSNWSGDALFDGAIDNLVIANGAMSASQVAALYAQTNAFTVPENAANGTALGTVVVSDRDVADTYTFSLSDSAGGRFAVAADGTITVANGALLDFETTPSHTITVLVTDSGGGTRSENYTITLSNVNEAPSFTSLNGTSSHTEGGAAVVLDADVQVVDPELGYANSYAGAALTLVRSGGANAQDALAFDGTNVTTSGAGVFVGGVQVGTYTFTGGQLTVSFSANATQARVNTLLQNIVYWNTSDAPPASVQIDWLFNDGNTGAQGSGGALQATGSTTVTIMATNDAPLLTISGSGSVTAGLPYTLNLSATDPDGVTITSWTINWGDGTIVTYAGNPASVTHTYTRSGFTYNVLASATDADGTWLQNTLAVPRWAGGGSNDVRLIHPNGTTVNFGFGSLTNAVDVVQGPDGQLYVSGYTSDNIMRFNADGTGGAVFVGAGSGGLNGVASIAFGPDDNLYAANGLGNNILRFNGATGAFIDVFASGGGLNNPNGIVFGPDGNIYVSNYYSSDIIRFDGTSGALIGTFVSHPAINGAEEMLFGPDGNLYLANRAGNNVLRFDGASGAYIGVFASAAGMTSVGGIAFGPDGHLYVSDWGSDSVRRFNGSTGALMGTVVSGGLADPQYLTFIAQHQVSVTANAAPAVTTSGGAASYVENAAAVAVDPALLVSDADSTMLAGATVRISANYVNGQDVLAFTDQGGITGAWDAGTGTLTLSGSATVAQYQTALRSVTYVNTSDAPSTFPRSVTFTVSDGLSSSAAIRNVNVTATNDAPVITSDAGGATASVSVAESTTAVTTVASTDVDGLSPAYSIVPIASGGGADAARFTIDPVTGVLRFAVAPDFETPTDDNADNVYEVTVQVSDGAGGVDTQLISVAVTNAAEPPSNTVPGAQSVDEDTALVIGGLSVADVDGDLSTVRLTVGNGTVSVSLAGGASISAGANGSATLTLSGTQAQINAALAAITYQGSANFNGNDTLTVLSTDATSATDSDTVTITVNPVNDAPVLDNTGSPTLATITEDQTTNGGQSVASIIASAGGDRITDADAGAVEGIAIVARSYGPYMWEYSIDNGASWINMFTVSDTSALLLRSTDLVRVVPDGNNGASATLRFHAWDHTSGTVGTKVDILTNGGSTAFSTANETATITITALNDAPVVATTGAALAYTENQAATAIDAALTVADVDNANLTGATVSISGNFAGGQDVLAFNDQNGITGSWNASTGVLTLSGTASVADYQTALRNITYVNTSEAPSTAVRTVSFIVNDGSADSAPATRTITVAALNDAPVLAFGEADKTFTEGTLAVMVDALATVSDIDSTNFDTGTLTVTISANASADDRVELLNTGMGAGQIGVAGGNVYYGGTLIGTQSGGIGAVPFTVTFNASADATAVREVMRNVRFWVAGDAPSTATRTIDAMLTDGDGGTSAAATKQIAVVAANDAPVITSDGGGSSAAIAIAENTTAVTTVMSTDVDGGAPAYSIVGGADAALFSIDAVTGALTFLVAPDFETPGSAGGNNLYNVTVQVSDGNGGTDTQAILVAIIDVNEAPVITSNGGGSTATVSVGENQTAVTTVTSSDVDGGAPAYSIAGGADAALFTINATTGELTFTAAPNFEAPADAGGNNIYDVTVQVADGNGGFDTQAISVTVTNVNEAPAVATPIADQTATEDVPFSFTFVAATFNDVDVGDTVTYSASGLPAWLSFDAATRTFSGTPADADVGAFTVTVRATDGSGLWVEDPFDIVVASVNDAPATADASASGAEDAVSIAVTLTGSDLDGTVTQFRLSSLPANGTLYVDAGLTTLAATGMDYAASAQSLTLYFVPAADWNGVTAFQYAARDSDGALDATPATATITVTPVNDAPVITSNGGGATAAVATAENTTAVTTVTSSDIDGGTAQYAITGGADAALFSIDTATGVLTFNAPPDYEAPADAGGNNVYDVTVQVADGNGGFDTQAISVTVTNVNEAPVITSGAAASVAENQTAVTTVTSSDVDGGVPSYSIVGGADAALFSIDAATGVLTFNAPPDYEAPADAGGNNVYDVTVRVADGIGGFDTQAISVTVTNVNEAPVVSVPAAQSGDEDTPLAITGLSVDDADGNLATVQLSVGLGTLSVSLAGGAGIAAGVNDSASLTLTGTQAQINAALATLTYLGATDFNGSDTLTVLATDALGTSSSDTVAITGAAVNDAPVVTSGAGFSVAENTALATVLTSSDVDGGTPAWSIAGGADAARFAIDSVSGQVRFATLPNFESPADADGDNVYQLLVSVDDGSGGVTQQLLSITITDVNEAPTVSVPAAASIDELTAAGTLLLTASASDPDAGDAFAFSLPGDGGGRFVIDAVNGEVRVAPGAVLDFETAPSHMLLLRVTDAQGLVTERTIAVTLGNVAESVAPPDIAPAPAPDPGPIPAPAPAPAPGPEAAPAPSPAPAPAPAPGRESASERVAIPALDEAQATPLLRDARGGSDVVRTEASTLPARDRSGGRDDGAAPVFGVSFLPPGQGLGDWSAALLDALLAQGPASTDTPLRLNTLSWRGSAIEAGPLDDGTPASSDEPSRAFVAAVQDPVRVASATLTAGFVWWLTRSGGLLTSILMGIPAWRHVDLLPVLAPRRDDDDEGDTHDETPPTQRDSLVDHLFSNTSRLFGDTRISP